MTSAKSDCSNSVKRANHFNTNQKPFPDIRDGKIDTKQFLEAAEDLLTFVEKLGKHFALLVYDMKGNVEKIKKRYQSDVVKNVTLHDMLLSDNGEEENLSRVGLLWFSRTLHFIEEFVGLILKTTDEDITEEFKQAYSLTLKPFHNWAFQRVFAYICEMCPRRSHFFNSLEGEPEESSFYEDMETFLQSLRVNRIEIYRIFTDHKLKNDTII